MSRGHLPTVAILTTGGTIAGRGKAGMSTGYVPGTMAAGELMAGVPGLADIADIRMEEICNVNSDDITGKIWITLADRINELAKDPDIDGFVITHGTDTLEETAYFLHLTVKTDKPVVVTGAMRPATSLSADGNMNLYQAAAVAASKEARGKGVICAFSDRLYSARTVTKASTYAVTGFDGGDLGAIGLVRDNQVFFYAEPGKRHTTRSEFTISAGDRLPRVSVIYFHVDADPDILKYAAARSDGLVMAGAGAGEFSKQFFDVIHGLKIPVVISSRTNSGIITQNAVLCKNTISADNLQPQKAAVLLRLALMRTRERGEIVRIFGEY